MRLAEEGLEWIRVVPTAPGTRHLLSAKPKGQPRRGGDQKGEGWRRLSEAAAPEHEKSPGLISSPEEKPSRKKFTLRRHRV
jgi:hypothetical protein